MSPNIDDRELAKFRDAGDLSKVAVSVEQESSNPIPVYSVGSLIGNITFDKVAVSYPTTLTEEYSYLLSSVEQARIRLTYLTASKKDLSLVERV